MTIVSLIVMVVGAIGVIIFSCCLFAGNKSDEANYVCYEKCTGKANECNHCIDKEQCHVVDEQYENGILAQNEYIKQLMDSNKRLEEENNKLRLILKDLIKLI